MANEDNKNKSFIFDWCIENFKFCWHKTGERLESPLFFLDTPLKTFWRLWLYPRGEDDGEYISCYLFREDGGPNVVDVDFELSLLIGESIVKSAVSFLKIYSFKSGQREGLKCFASLWEVFAPMDTKNETFTLTFRCRIFNVLEDGFKGAEMVGRTLIEIENISATEIFEGGSDLQLESSKDIEVTPLLEDYPVININLSYFEERLIIKIHPKFCDKIKYAFLKIVVIKAWTNECPNATAFRWNGRIKSVVWTLNPEAGYDEGSFKTLPNKTFFLKYDFTFTTGVEIVHNKLRENNSYLEFLSVPSQGNLKKEPKVIKSVPTALDTLKSLCESESFSDIKLQVATLNIHAHKAILCARSSKLKSIITNPNTTLVKLPNTPTDSFRRFLLFLYTDTVGDLSWWNAINLYKVAACFEMEVLKTKCSAYLIGILDVNSASYLLSLADEYRDTSLRVDVLDYIITYYDLVMVTRTWKELFLRKKKLIKSTMLVKHKMKYLKYI